MIVMLATVKMTFMGKKRWL